MDRDQLRASLSEIPAVKGRSQTELADVVKQALDLIQEENRPWNRREAELLQHITICLEIDDARAAKQLADILLFDPSRLPPLERAPAIATAHSMDEIRERLERVIATPKRQH